MQDKLKAVIMAIIGLLAVYIIFCAAIVGIVIATIGGTKAYKKYAKTILGWLLYFVK